MKYYRDWWLATMFWWGLLVSDIVIATTTSWSDATTMEFFAQLFGVVIMAVFLLISGGFLMFARVDSDLEKLPSAEEKEMAKAHAELDLQFKLLKQEEELLQRRQQLAARREAYVQKLERESGLR